MFTSILLSAALLSPAAPVPKVTRPVGPPPILVYVSPAVDGRVTVNVQAMRDVSETKPITIVQNGVPVVVTATERAARFVTMSVTLDDAGATFATAGEKKLTPEEVTARLKAGGVLVAPSDGDEVDPSYLKALSADAIIVTYTGKGAERKTLQPARPRSNTAIPTVPTLVAVKADAKGVVSLPAMGKKEETVTVTTAVVENGVPTTKTREVKRTVTALIPTPFDDVKPTTTTADGKPVATDDAKKQLTAGAVVLVSGDGKPVDEVYRKLFRPTTLVLTSDKMALPIRSGTTRILGGLQIAPAILPVQVLPAK